jgi:BlaI family penicillinase repressor
MPLDAARNCGAKYFLPLPGTPEDGNRSIVSSSGQPTPNVSDAELDVLKILWEHGPATVRDVEARLKRRRRRWAYTTLLTLLTRLRDKGCVVSEKSDKAGAAHVFRATVSRDQLLRNGLAGLADRICDGTAGPLVHALVQGQQFSAEEIASFRKLLDELEGKK